MSDKTGQLTLTRYRYQQNDDRRQIRRLGRTGAVIR
jgi:hypothetical protein